MSLSRQSPALLLGLIAVFFLIRPSYAFGAGNIAGISSVEGQNWRHGDIEDTLLQLLMARAVGGKKFDKLMVSRVYFGNWLRDYSQAIDVGTVKSVSAEAIRLLLAVLGFMTFGYGSREFEVTAERLGCYRPEDHIDNPKNYADNLDARQYDRRLRGPVDERVELAIEPETGMKNYIANERANIMTSALHVRRLFTGCIELARQYRRSRNKAELHEALRLLGTGLHCLEDFLAHSNYIELALIEMGERDVFPHVGRHTKVRLHGARGEVYPIVTGTFGGVDFLHSVTGEVSDKLTQNEIQELEGTLQNSQNSDTSILKNLLDMIPDGIFGSHDKKHKMDEIQSNAAAAQMQNMRVSPREPEEFTRHVKQVFEQIMPAIEFHDEILQSITEAIEKIPVLPKMIEQIEDQLSIFVFSIMAPFVVPVIQQVKNELRTGSSEIIQSSENEQHIVFQDDRCSDPTHSMLSKDHFSDILNEIAGRTASKVVYWVVPQLMEAWDNDGIDIQRTINRIVHGVLHHPAQRDMGEDGARDGRAIMFRSVEEWWRGLGENEKSDYRRKLSREGVQRGENHKEGVHDTGHGCGKPLGMHKNFGGSGGNTMEDRIASAAAGAVVGGLTSGFSSLIGEETGLKLPGQPGFTGGIGGFMGGSGGRTAGPAGLGGILGAAGSLLEGAFSNKDTETFESHGRGRDGGYRETVTQYGRSQEGNRYEQAEFTRTEYPDGRERTDYSRYEQDEDRRGQRPVGYNYEETTQARPTYGGGGYEGRTERRWEGGRDEGEYRREEQTSEWRGGGGGQYQEQRQEESWGGGGRQQEQSWEQQEQGRRQEQSWEQQEQGRRQEQSWEQQEQGRQQEQSWEQQQGRRQEQRYEQNEERDTSGGGFGGIFGGGSGGGGGILGELAREVEGAFEESEDRDEYGRKRREERRDGWGL